MFLGYPFSLEIRNVLDPVGMGLPGSAGLVSSIVSYLLGAALAHLRALHQDIDHMTTYFLHHAILHPQCAHPGRRECKARRWVSQGTLGSSGSIIPPFRSIVMSEPITADLHPASVRTRIDVLRGTAAASPTRIYPIWSTAREPLRNPEAFPLPTSKFRRGPGK